MGVTSLAATLAGTPPPTTHCLLTPTPILGWGMPKKNMSGRPMNACLPPIRVTLEMPSGKSRIVGAWGMDSKQAICPQMPHQSTIPSLCAQSIDTGGDRGKDRDRYFRAKTNDDRFHAQPKLQSYWSPACRLGTTERTFQCQWYTKLHHSDTFNTQRGKSSLMPG